MLSNVMYVDTIQEQLQKEGLTKCNVSHMGGNMVLISFEDAQGKQEFLDNGGDWVRRWFDMVKSWEEEDVGESRVVWLKCTGIPLHLWNQRFFTSIGNLKGTYMDLDEMTRNRRQLDVA